MGTAKVDAAEFASERGCHLWVVSRRADPPHLEKLIPSLTIATGSPLARLVPDVGDSQTPLSPLSAGWHADRAGGRRRERAVLPPGSPGQHPRPAGRTGAVTDSYSYDPYGQRTAVTGARPTRPSATRGSTPTRRSGCSTCGRATTTRPPASSSPPTRWWTSRRALRLRRGQPAQRHRPLGLDNSCSRGTSRLLGSAAQAAGDAANVPFRAGLAAVNRSPVGTPGAAHDQPAERQRLLRRGERGRGVLFGTPQALLSLCAANAGALPGRAGGPRVLLPQHGLVILAAGGGGVGQLSATAATSGAGTTGRRRGHAPCGGLRQAPRGRPSWPRSWTCRAAPRAGCASRRAPWWPPPAARRRSSGCAWATRCWRRTPRPARWRRSGWRRRSSTRQARELARVDLSDGSAVTVTADHPFYVDAARCGRMRAGCRRATCRWVIGCAMPAGGT